MSKLAQERIEKHLTAGKPLTVKLCIKLFGSTELRTTVARLRKHFTIEDKWVKHGDDRYKVFWMPVRKISYGAKSK